MSPVPLAQNNLHTIHAHLRVTRSEPLILHLLGAIFYWKPPQILLSSSGL